MSQADTESTLAPVRGEGRIRILEESLRLFRERGYAAVSMQQIADAAGITKATMYHHFRNKDELFATIAAQVINEFWEGIIERTQQDRPLRNTLLDIATFVTRVSQDSAAWTLAEDVQLHLQPEIKREIFSQRPEPHRPLRALFQHSIDAGEIRAFDADLMSSAFLSMAMGINFQGQHREKRPSSPGDAEAIVDVFLNGITVADAVAHDDL